MTIAVIRLGAYDNPSDFEAAHTKAGRRIPAPSTLNLSPQKTSNWNLK